MERLLIVFVLGLCIGSFFNVILARWGREEGILWGRSRCPACGHRLAWLDLIPLASFFILRGRCRYCRRPISRSYPVVELATGMLVSLFVVLRSQGQMDAWYWVGMVAVCIFLLAGLFDYRSLVLPDEIIGVLLFLGLCSLAIWGWQGFAEHLGAGFLFSALFAILYAVSGGRWVGFGDVKLLFVIGLLFGYALGFAALMAAVASATIVALVLIARGKASLKTALPFGSFLAGASIVILLFYDKLQHIRGIF